MYRPKAGNAMHFSCAPGTTARIKPVVGKSNSCRPAPIYRRPIEQKCRRSLVAAIADRAAVSRWRIFDMGTQVVLITGALTGIGRATAMAFASEGSNLVVSGRRDDAGLALAKELHSLGAAAEFVRADVRREDEVRSLVAQTIERFGRLDVAVNNAGTEGKPGPVTEQSAESYAATFDTNVLGTLLSMKHELRVMRAQGHGSIVNLSSTTGSKAAPGASVYTASKHAVEGLTKSAALDAAAFEG